MGTKETYIMVEIPVTAEFREEVLNNDKVTIELPRKPLVGDRLQDRVAYGQKRTHSFLEKLSESVIAFLLSVLCAPYFFSWCGIPPTEVNQEVRVVILFTILSLFRGYIFRRIGNYFMVRRLNKERAKHGRGFVQDRKSICE